MWVLQQRPLLEGTYSHADATPPPAQQVRTYPCCPWDMGWATGGGDTSILHPPIHPSIRTPSYPLTSYLLTSYLPSYSDGMLASRRPTPDGMLASRRGPPRVDVWREAGGIGEGGGDLGRGGMGTLLNLTLTPPRTIPFV